MRAIAEGAGRGNSTRSCSGFFFEGHNQSKIHTTLTFVTKSDSHHRYFCLLTTLDFIIFSDESTIKVGDLFWPPN